MARRHLGTELNNGNIRVVLKLLNQRRHHSERFFLVFDGAHFEFAKAVRLDEEIEAAACRLDGVSSPRGRSSSPAVSLSATAPAAGRSRFKAAALLWVPLVLLSYAGVGSE